MIALSARSHIICIDAVPPGSVRWRQDHRRSRRTPIPIVAFNEASVALFGASEINILGTGLIMVLTLMYFPNGIVGTLARKNRLPRAPNHPAAGSGGYISAG